MARNRTTSSGIGWRGWGGRLSGSERRRNVSALLGAKGAPVSVWRARDNSPRRTCAHARSLIRSTSLPGDRCGWAVDGMAASRSSHQWLASKAWRRCSKAARPAGPVSRVRVSKRARAGKNFPCPLCSDARRWVRGVQSPPCMHECAHRQPESVGHRASSGAVRRTRPAARQRPAIPSMIG